MMSVMGMFRHLTQFGPLVSKIGVLAEGETSFVLTAHRSWEILFNSDADAPPLKRAVEPSGPKAEPEFFHNANLHFAEKRLSNEKAEPS